MVKVLWIVSSFLLTSIFAASFTNIRISDGRGITIKDVPFQASIQTEDGSHFCGGTLISTRIVVTAAQCVYQISDPSSIYIRLGSSDRSDGGKLITASDFTYHENFNAETLENDIALIRLSRAVKGLHTADLALSDFPTGTKALVSGWGVDGSEEPPENLQGAETEMIPHEVCARDFGDIFVRETKLCSSFDQQEGITYGDAGGPLSVEGILTGIISSGAFDEKGEFIGFYSSIPQYFEWIRTNMGYLLFSNLNDD